jgi:hypothetical protein
MKRWLGLALALSLVSPASAQFNPSNSTATVATTVAASSIVARTTPGGFMSAYGENAAAAAGWLMAFDATAVPADGAVTPLAICHAAAASGCTIDMSPGVPVTTGLVVVWSSTGPFTKTAATAYIQVQYQ